MNIHSSLIAEMKDKAYRDAYVASQIRIAIPMQIRALRKSRKLSQPELAKLSGMAQPRISEIETPGERRPNIETLLRLAAALDVGLEVKFVAFDQLIDDSENVDLDNFSIKTFDQLLEDAEREAAIRKKEPDSVKVTRDGWRLLQCGQARGWQRKDVPESSEASNLNKKNQASRAIAQAAGGAL